MHVLFPVYEPLIVATYYFLQGRHDCCVHNSGLTGDPTTAKVEIDRRMLDFVLALTQNFQRLLKGLIYTIPRQSLNRFVCLILCRQCDISYQY